MFNMLNFDDQFKNFLLETRGVSKIVDVILYSRGRFLKMSGDFIRKEPGNETISFIPKSKLGLGHDGFSDSKYRTPLKIGRFVSKFISKEGISEFEIKNQDIETFVNIYKSFFDRDESRLKIVEGDDILKYYHLDSYYRPNDCCVGSLWKSCMRYEHKNRYMDIYAKNPEKIKMLVLLAEDGRVKTRALLWESCQDKNKNQYKIMDRIYSVYDHDVVFFKKWALDNGYLHKYEQSAKSENIFMTPNGQMQIDLIVNLENHVFDYYPYIDSFKYYSRKSGTLSNSNQFKYKYILVQNDGELSQQENEEYHDDW